MMPLQRLPVLLLLLSALTVISGCARKKTVVVTVPKEQPPVTAATPAPTPEAKTESQKPEPATQTPEQTESQETTKASPESPGKKSHHRRGAIKKPSPVVKAENTPPEARPEPRSTPAPISPSISPTDAQRDQNNTEQLLQTTENTLNSIKRQLSKEEEAMVAQARSYINQSRQATKDNDPARARTLAQKANLLSNELVRR
jgi:hypothetical protein